LDEGIQVGKVSGKTNGKEERLTGKWRINEKRDCQGFSVLKYGRVGYRQFFFLKPNPTVGIRFTRFK